MPESTKRLDILGIPEGTLKEVVGEEIHNVLKDLATGAAADIQAYALQIGRDMVDAQNEADADKRAARMAELKGQASAVTELNRIRLNNAGWKEFEKIFDFGTVLLDRALALGIAAI